MPIDFYQIPASSPCRAVALTAAAVGVELNPIMVNLSTGEHLKPEYLKLNPQHTVPTINDNGLCLWESRAIMTYLVEQYGKDDSLYPKDPKKRAVVNQRLYFDMGSMYQSFSEYYYPTIFAGAPADKAKYEKMQTTFSFLDKFLEGENYVAGKNLTVADIALATTVSNFEMMEFDMSGYKNVVRWFEKVKTEIVKYNDINLTGIKQFKAYADKLQKERAAK